MNSLGKDNPAWMILTEEERLAIHLFHGSDKSTWQAGEILKKAHYKYLEIKSRGEKFLKMFTEHYELYDDLFPNDIIISNGFRLYLKLVILKRKKLHQAIQDINNPLFWTASSRDELIISEVNKLRTSHKTSERNFYNLLMEFDRWNNFRILPKPIQEPSAFKRRDKNRHRKHLKTLTNMHPFSIKEIIRRYKFKPKSPNVKHIGYITIIRDIQELTYEVVPIHSVKIIMAEMNKIGIYVFKNKEIATEFISIILTYYDKETRHCTDGQKFWPQYRILIKKALNYNAIQNIIPSRKYLEYALKDIDPRLVKPKKYSEREGPAKRM